MPGWVSLCDTGGRRDARALSWLAGGGQPGCRPEFGPCEVRSGRVRSGGPGSGSGEGAC